ncbi:hypothetical protein BG262_04410 [Floricoccus penangensis]|uniref:Uncharacterized protein n=1 Tax=Floricoccus penangensis TaxID=1859475 RepID=A0A9Q5NZ54_9LACT|nr:hypothetical protein [Floricoccus penangensis]OFI46264.1 hypothetical protein BG262_04410 [Floricoccus penangensis]
MTKEMFFKTAKSNIEITLLIFIIMGIDQIVVKRQDVVNLYTDGIVIIVTILSINILRETNLSMWKTFLGTIIVNYILVQIMQFFSIHCLSFNIYVYIFIVVLLIILALISGYLYNKMHNSIKINT